MKKKPLLFCFFIILLGLTISDLCKEDKKFSDLENRNLKGKVEFSIGKYFDGSFSKKYEEYINDQFILRDNWIDLKSKSEFLLGKTENNNIIYGKEGYLFEKFTNLNKHRIKTNINAINKLIENVEVNVSTMIVPNSYEIYKEFLPKGAPQVNQEEELEKIYSMINDSNKINLNEVMKNMSSKELFYKTDHHWTIDGAYLAYAEFITSIGEVAVNLREYKRNTVYDFLGTYYSKAKPFKVKSDYFSYYDISDITIEIDNVSYNGLYDYSKLDVRDKYSMFLYGNNPLTIIKNTKLKNNKKLLVFKDSYANSMVPFLTQNFEEIHVIDLRSFSNKISEYINNNSFNEILILYNFINFNRDADLLKLNS